MNTENDEKMQPKFRGFFRKNGKIFKLFQYHRKTRKTCLDSLNRPHLHVFTSKLLKSRFWFSEIFSIFRSVIFDIENHKNCCYVKVNVVVDDPKYVLESFWDALKTPQNKKLKKSLLVSFFRTFSPKKIAKFAFFRRVLVKKCW